MNGGLHGEPHGHGRGDTLRSVLEQFVWIQCPPRSLLPVPSERPYHTPRAEMPAIELWRKYGIVYACKSNASMPVVYIA